MAKGLCFIGLLIVAMTLLEGKAMATTYTVGDIGWRVPSNVSFYENWVKDKTFKIGDSVVFNWTSTHNVLRVTSKAEYDSCRKTSGFLQEMSPVTFNFTQNDTYYVICTIGPHCPLGQKVTLVVGNGITPKNGASSAFLSSTIKYAQIAAGIAHLSWFIFF